MEIKETDLHWLAGLIEGEGCFHLKANGGCYISLQMTDEDVVRKAYELTGIGTFTKARKLPNRKQTWVWRAGKRKEVVALAKLLQPLMGSRRASKIQELLDKHDTHPPERAPKGVLVHGIRGGYVKGCRCELCKQAESNYQEDYKRRKSNGLIQTKGKAFKPYQQRGIQRRHLDRCTGNLG